ncbi:hypothetical protein LPJ73_006620, partial [Coemansia sp. RSA 2703]
LTIASTLLLVGHAMSYDIIHASSLNCRKEATTKSDIVKVYNLGENVDIACQTKGQLVSGTSIWDMTPDGCYVLDYYLQTGYSGIFKTLCSDFTATGGASTSQTSGSKNANESSTSSHLSGSSTASALPSISDDNDDLDETFEESDSGISSEDEQSSLPSDVKSSNKHSGHEESDDVSNEDSLSSGATGRVYKSAATAVLAVIGGLLLIPSF